MSDLATFLLARIAEDEELARQAAVPRYEFMSWEDHLFTPDRETTEAQERYLVEFAPPRILAECQAKRRIVEWIAERDEPVALDPLWPLRLLALPYADHPDYRQEWAP